MANADDSTNSDVPEWLTDSPRLSPQAKLLYVALRAREAFSDLLDLDDLGTAIGASARKAEFLLAELETAGLIRTRPESRFTVRQFPPMSRFEPSKGHA